MHRLVHTGFLAAFAGAVTMSTMSPARALDVPALCAKLDNNDKVKPIPASLVPKARQLFGISNTPNGFIQKTTSFRCMGDKAWLCNTGANLDCGKANTSRTSSGASEFCKQNPGSDVVPMAATGHDTIFEWKCVGSNATITKTFATVDPRGFLTDNWKPLD